MGSPVTLKRYASPRRGILAELPRGLARRRPRAYAEWKALRRWGKLPPWEDEPIGYVMRLARETSGLTQAVLARRLDCTQQAVAQAERWNSNPTVEFLRRWVAACGRRVKLEIA